MYGSAAGYLRMEHIQMWFSPLCLHFTLGNILNFWSDLNLDSKFEFVFDWWIHTFDHLSQGAKTVKQLNWLGMGCVCLDFWLIWYSGRALFFFLLSSPSQLLVLEPQLCLCLPSRFAEQFQYTPSLQTSVLVIQCRTPNKKTTPPFYILGVRIV